jgi:GNAT superfamily N-acetyltransferase
LSGTFEIVHASAAEAHAVFTRIPEFDAARTPLTDFERRLAGRRCVLLAVVGGDAVGFKAGYDRYRDASFYSWLGGVLPAARTAGVARALLEAQEAWASKEGFRAIYVKTRNRFVGMRVLLARRGYQIIGYSQDGATSPADGRITFVKVL